MLLKYNEQTRAGTVFTVAVCASLVFQLLFSLVLAGAGITGTSELYNPENFGLLMTAQVFLPIFVGGAVWLFLRNRKRYVQTSVWNWRKPKAFDAVLSVFLGIAICFACGFVNELFVQAFEAGGIHNSNDFGNPADWGQFVAYALILCALPAFSEELIYRGAMNSFMSSAKPWKVCVTTAALFALMHMNIFQMPNAFLAGLLLAYLVVKTGSIFCAVIAHFVNNLTTVLLGFLGPIELPELFLGFNVFDVTMAAVSVLFIAFTVWYYWKEKKKTGVAYPENAAVLEGGRVREGLLYALPGILVAVFVTALAVVNAIAG